MLGLSETTNRGVETACGCTCHCLCLGFVSVARVGSGFVMIARASGIGMGVGRFSRLLREVGVLAMLDVGRDKMRRIQSVCADAAGAGVLVPGIAVGVLIDHHCVVDGVKVMCWVIAAMRELLSEEEWAEFWPWIVEAMDLNLWEESLSPGGAETRLCPGGSWDFPNSLRFCCFWTFCMTRVVSGWGHWEGIVTYRCLTLTMKESFPLHAYAMAAEVDSYLSDHRGIQNERQAQCRLRSTLDHNGPWRYSGTRSLENHSILGLTAIRLNSALISAVTATSEGLSAPLEGCLCLVCTMIIVLHLFLAQYFEPLILYIFSFLVEIPLWQS